MKKNLCFILAGLLLLSMVACGRQEQTIDPVLAQRRDTAENYMRTMLSVLWSPEEDILYTLGNQEKPEDAPRDKLMLLKADRVYRGMPYSYAGSSLATFLEYAGQPDETGVRTVSNLPWNALSGNGHRARVGIDGSSALMLSWAQIGRSFTFTSSSTMTQARGYLHVGNYTSKADSNMGSDKTCQDNGQDVMFAAYAQLQKADCLSASLKSGGHTMMVVDVHVVASRDGIINGAKSYVTTLGQSRKPVMDQAHYYDEQLGCDVYTISSIDVTYTFDQLFSGGYLPMTCKELIDPAPVEEAYVNDSNPAPSAMEFLNGELESNYYIDTITATTTDMEGNIIQQAAMRAPRYDNLIVDLQRFNEEEPGKIRGEFDYNTLEPGKYRSMLVCRLINGQEFTLRDITFEKES